MNSKMDEKETLKKTREFLENLSNPDKVYGIPKNIRDYAKKLLEEYPYYGKIDILYKDQ